jgi:hypothetical protein
LNCQTGKIETVEIASGRTQAVLSDMGFQQSFPSVEPGSFADRLIK